MRTRPDFREFREHVVSGWNELLAVWNREAVGHTPADAGRTALLDLYDFFEAW
jgi:hypothetical protein